MNAKLFDGKINLTSKMYTKDQMGLIYQGTYGCSITMIDSLATFQIFYNLLGHKNLTDEERVEIFLTALQRILEDGKAILKPPSYLWDNKKKRHNTPTRVVKMKFGDEIAWDIPIEDMIDYLRQKMMEEDFDKDNLFWYDKYAPSLIWDPEYDEEYAKYDESKIFVVEGQGFKQASAS
ncbi:hypothetical protein [Campylobacter sp. RM16188]|uniref:hypothetical protein n=1 Tax=Campylobacter sp. RM16188 TaxID=1705725 RepID=UPI0015558084|nr:hypothetical protein [Campylobacter sp. RM16188]